jgi:lysophospholipase L1-like esterase
MKRPLLLALALVFLAAVVLAAAAVGLVGTSHEPEPRGAQTSGARAVDDAPAPRYYVSLGDSLAVGYQPGRLTSPEGYADRLLAALREDDPRLELVQLGCPAETTRTLRRGGGLCGYPEGSQLDRALAFLREHRGRVALVTVMVGGNDLLPCRPADEACVERGFAAVERNLPAALTALRQAAGRDVPVVGATYYAPGLASWVRGPAGRARARAHVERVVRPGNALLRSLYGEAGITVADVAGAFSTDETLPEDGTALPAGVAAICRLTWMCSRGDVHPNAQGYETIARAFARALE